MQKTFHHSLRKVFDSCLTALKRLEMQVEYHNADEGVISASTQSSLLSWGETIDIRLKEETKNTVIITVKSNSVAQLIDWGKNETNEVNILNTISELLKG